jgi:hypothetical protein
VNQSEANSNFAESTYATKLTSPYSMTLNVFQMFALQVIARTGAEQHAAPGPLLLPQMLNLLDDTDSDSDCDKE